MNYTTLQTLTTQYQLFILDIWGVLHDGQHPFPGVIEALARLKAEDKHVVLLSNAPRRAQTIAAYLENMGITPNLYARIFSSGEATHDWLKTKFQPQTRFYHLGSFNKDKSLYDGLPLIKVEDIHEAHLLLNSGPETFEDNLETSKPILDLALQHNLPMICSNPDKVVMSGNHQIICAGTLAEYYEMQGGQVTYLGKPHAPIYEGIFSHPLYQGLKPKAIALGDGLETDILGANNFGIDCAWVIDTGIHKHQNLTELHHLCDQKNLKPTHFIKSLSLINE